MSLRSPPGGTRIKDYPGPPLRLVAIVGGVLIYVGRDTFGRAHSRNTTFSVLFYIISIATIIIGKILFGAVLELGRIPNGTITYGNTTSSTVNPYLIRYTTSAIATALTGLAIVFLTYALHRKIGRIILSISYIAFLTLTTFDDGDNLPRICNALLINS